MSKQARVTFKVTMDYARWRRELIREVALRVCGRMLANADIEYAETLESAKKIYYEVTGCVRPI